MDFHVMMGGIMLGNYAWQDQFLLGILKTMITLDLRLPLGIGTL
jgi:hypothetical protein